MRSKIEKLANTHIWVNISLIKEKYDSFRENTLLKQIEINAKIVDLFQVFDIVHRVFRRSSGLGSHSIFIQANLKNDDRLIFATEDWREFKIPMLLDEADGSLCDWDLLPFCQLFGITFKTTFEHICNRVSRPKSVVEMQIADKVFHSSGKKIFKLYAEIIDRLNASEYLADPSGNHYRRPLKMLEIMLPSRMTVIKYEDFIPQRPSIYNNMFITNKKTKNNIRTLTLIQLPIELHTIVIKKFNIF